MAFAIWNRTIQDEQGNVQAGASVEVRNSNTNQLATLYSDREGTTLKTNPFLTDVNGYAFFFAVGGAYNVTASKGAYQMTFPYEAVGTSAETDFEQLAQMLESGVFPFQTVAQMNAFTPTSTPSAAVVYTGSGSGYYNWTGTAWSYSRALPDTFARLVTTGGTANAPVAAVGAGVNPSSPTVFFIDGVTPNTGSVTLTITGLGSGVVRNAAGNVLTAGEWQGRVFLTRESNGEFKIVNDPASALAAAQSATLASAEANRAEAEANRAESAASSIPVDAVRYGTAQTLTPEQQAQARDNINAFAATDVGIYNSISVVESTTIPPSLNAIRLNGYYDAGDGGGALYKRVASEPSHAGKVQSADGTWWGISASAFEPRMFGAKSDYNLTTGSGTNSYPALQRMFDTSKAMGTPIVISGRYRSDGTLTITNSPVSIKGEWFSGAIIASNITTGFALDISQDTYVNSTYIDGLTLIALGLQTSGGALRVQYTPADSIGNRNYPRCVVSGVNALPRNLYSNGWKNGLVLSNVHNATIEEFTATGYRDMSFPDTNPASWTHMTNGIELQAETGMTSLPADVRIINPRIYHALNAIHANGNHEGLRIDNPILVGVGTGIHYHMDSARPWLQVESGHINYLNYGIVAINAPQSNINNLLLYKFENSDQPSYGIELRNCDHSQVSGIRFNNLCSDASVNGEHHGVVLSGSNFCTIDDLIHHKPSRTIWLKDGASNNRIGKYLRQGSYTGASSLDGVYDEGINNEYGGVISVTKNYSTVTLTGSGAKIVDVTGVSLVKGDRVRVSIVSKGVHGTTAGVLFLNVGHIAGGGGMGFFGLDAPSFAHRSYGVNGDWDATFGAVFSCAASGTFQFELLGVSTGSDSTVAVSGAQMTIERL